MDDVTSPYRLRNYAPSDEATIHLLNNAQIPHVTLFAPGELGRLADQAFRFRVAELHSGEPVGFVLALDQTASYSSLNFQWFKARYPQFVYVDRIVVSDPAQGAGVGRLLYSDLVAAAQEASPILTCEVNIHPPNRRSLDFHERSGFMRVGEQETEGGKKTVALMTKALRSVVIG